VIPYSPIRTLCLHQGWMLTNVAGTLKERVILDMMFGHGWQGIEIRRILAKDVTNIHKSLICCWGKERNASTRFVLNHHLVKFAFL
jgi:hypothetical protein